MKSSLQIADEFLSKWDGKTCHPKSLAKVLRDYRNEGLKEAMEEIRALIKAGKRP